MALGLLTNGLVDGNSYISVYWKALETISRLSAQRLLVFRRTMVTRFVSGDKVPRLNVDISIVLHNIFNQRRSLATLLKALETIFRLSAQCLVVFGRTMVTRFVSRRKALHLNVDISVVSPTLFSTKNEAYLHFFFLDSA